MRKFLRLILRVGERDDPSGLKKEKRSTKAKEEEGTHRPIHIVQGLAQ